MTVTQLATAGRQVARVGKIDDHAAFGLVVLEMGQPLRRSL